MSFLVAFGYGLSDYATGLEKLGALEAALSFPMLLPVLVLRRGLSTRASAFTFLATSGAMVFATTWVSGATQSTAIPFVILLPLAVSMLLEPRDARRAFAVGVVGLLVVLAGDLLGWPPPSWETTEDLDVVRTVATLVSVLAIYAFARVFDHANRSTAERLAGGSRRMAKILEELATASADLRAAAGPLSRGTHHAEAQANGEPNDAQPEDMRIEVEHVRRMLDETRVTVGALVQNARGLHEDVETMVSHILAVDTPLSRVHAIADRLDLMALHMGIEAAGAGKVGAAFGALGRSARVLAEEVHGHTAALQATLDEIRTSAERAAERTSESLTAVSSATPQLPQLNTSFERVYALIERAAEINARIVSATMTHLTTLREHAVMAQGARAQENTLGAKRRLIQRVVPLALLGNAIPSLGSALFLWLMGVPVFPLFLSLVGVGTLLPFLFRRRPSFLKVSIHTLLLSSAVTMLIGSWLSGGAASPAFPGFVIIPIIAVFLLERTGSRLWTLFAIVGTVGTGLLGVYELLPPSLLSPLVTRIVGGFLAIVFAAIVFVWASLLVRVAREHTRQLSAGHSLITQAVEQLGSAGEVLREATWELVGDGAGRESLVMEMEREAQRGDRQAAQTLDAFQALVAHYVDIRGVMERAHARAAAVGEGIARVNQMSVDIETLALQVSLQAVHVGVDGGPFQLLAQEMTNLATAVGEDAVEMRSALLGVGQAVSRAHASAEGGGREIAGAIHAVSELAEAFTNVCALVERGAVDGEELAKRADRHLESLREGVKEALPQTAAARRG